VSPSPRQRRRGGIVSIGDLVADVVVEVPALPIRAGDFQHVQHILLEPGGNANFLICASRLGAGVSALGNLGEDLWGGEIAALLALEEVDLSGAAVGGTTTVVVVLVGEGGDHAFVGMHGHGRPLSLDNRLRARLSSAQAVFASGYSLQDKRIAGFTLDAFPLAHQRGVRTFFDPGPAFMHQEPGVRAELLQSTDMLLLTEEELAGLEAGPVESVMEMGPGVVVVKRGANGCSVYTQAGESFDVEGLNVRVRDTTAAGDCFDAAFVVGVQQNRPLIECATIANAVGAAKVQKLGGGRNVPTLEEVRQIIDQFDLRIVL
jgi:sugar/nucleoside kinase (ribokinase family)